MPNIFAGIAAALFRRFRPPVAIAPAPRHLSGGTTVTRHPAPKRDRALVRAMYETRQRREEMASGDDTQPTAQPVIGSGDLVTGVNDDAPFTRTPAIDL
jgi:hypothetical protein